MPPGPGRGRLTRGTAALLAVVAGFAVFAPTLRYGFVWDDRATVLFNREIRSLGNAPTFFTGHAFSGAADALRDIKIVEYYRPLWVLSLAVDHALWGERASGYHLTNVLLHVLASGLTAWLVFELVGSAMAAAVAGTLFAVHPIHAEAVAWVSARNEMLLCVLLQLAFIACVRLRRGAGTGARTLCLAAFALALLSKETAVLFPAIVLLYAWAGRGAAGERKAAGKGATLRERYGWVLLLAAVAAVFMVFRAGIVSPLPVHEPLSTRIATAPGLVLQNLRLLFVPVGLKVLHTFEPVASPLSAAALLPAALLLGVLALLPIAFRFDANLGFGLGWILLALVPVSGLAALLQPTPLAERYLYLPSVGWALAVGSLIAGARRRPEDAVAGPGPAAGPGAARTSARARSKPPRATPRVPARVWQAASLVAVPVFAAAAIAHSRPWRSDLTLATRMCRDAPRSALAHSSLGLATYRLGRWPEAASEFGIAAGLRPLDPWSHYYEGCSLRRSARLEPAERALRNALGLGMRYAHAHLELGETLEQAGRLEEAERECRAAIGLDSSLVEAHSALGRVLYGARRYDEAERAYREALALRPDDARTRSNLGGLYMAMGRWEEAIAELERARTRDPGLAEAHFNLGSALFERRRLPEAERALRSGLALQPGAAAERITLGRVLLAQGRGDEAAREVEEALRSAPADSSLRRAAAQALQAGRRP